MKILFVFIICFNSLYYSQWLSTNGPFGQEITTLDRLNNDSLLVGTKNSGLFLYVISEARWENIFSAEYFNEVYSVVITPERNILLVVRNQPRIEFPKIIKIDKDFKKWRFITDGELGNFAVIKDENVNKILLHDRWDGFFSSEDEGETWDYFIVPQNIYGIRDIKFDPKIGRIYIATDPSIDLTTFAKILKNTTYVDNGIVISDDYTKNWQTLYEGAFDKVFINDNIILGRLILHSGGNYMQSSDYGITWQHAVSSKRFNDIVFTETGIVYAAYNDGIYCTQENGLNWQLINTEAKNLIKVEIISEGSLYFGSLNGLYSYSVTENVMEDRTKGLYSTEIYTLYCSKNNRLIGGGYSGGIFYSTDFGEHWQYDNNNIVGRDNDWGSVYAIAESSTGRLLAGTSYEDVLYYKDNDIDGWQKFYLNSNIPVEYWALAVNSEDRIYIGTNKDGIYSVNADGTDQKILPLNLQSIASLHIDEYDNIFAGSSWGTVFKSTDRGVSWSAFSNGLNYLPVISIQKGQDLYAATVYNVIRFDEDSGSWINISHQLPEDIFITDFLLKKDLLVVATSNHGIFTSRDFGETWETLNENLPGLKISAIVLDKNNYLYSSTIKGIYRTNSQVVSVKGEENITDNTDLLLENNYPNPFNASTLIKVKVGSPQRVKIKIYDVMGSEVKQIIDKFLKPGNYDFYWGGDNDNNNQVSSGVYLIHLIGSNHQLFHKTIFLK